MKKILVPCDFSNPAVNAYRLALEIAQKSNGEVHLLHVIELPVIHDTVLMPVLTFEQALMKELEEKSQKKFDRILKKYPTERVKLITKVAFGAPSRMITDYIEAVKIDLVVMGTQGASGFREVFIGSNTEKIVRHSSVPVLAVRKYVSADSITNIVFPNELETENQEDLVMNVKALQHFFKARLHIVWINTPTTFTRDTTTLKRLNAFAKRFMLKDYSINIYNDKYEEAGIMNFALSVKADMIAMGTHGRKGLAHLISGSLTEDIVNHLKFPIWTHTIKSKK